MSTRTVNPNVQNAKIADSRIVAKSVIRVDQADGKPQIYVLAVYAESTDDYFYWVYSAKSARAGRKSWKLLSRQSRGMAADFKTFTQNFINLYKGIQLVSIRVPSKRVLTRVTIEPHVIVIPKLPIRPNRRDPRDFEMQNRRLRRKMRGAPIFWPTSPRHK